MSERGVPALQRWENPTAGRYYEARCLQNLFGGWTVLCTWGAIGSARGGDQSLTHADLVACHQAIGLIDKRRRQRGYAPAVSRPALNG